METYFLIGVIIAIIYYLIVIANLFAEFSNSQLLVFVGEIGCREDALPIALVGFFAAILIIFLYPFLLWGLFVKLILSFIKRTKP